MNITELKELINECLLEQESIDNEVGFDKDELENLNSKEDILNYLTLHEKNPEIVKLGKDEVVIFDDYIIDDFDFPSVEEKENWIWTSNAQRLISHLTNEVEDRFNTKFWNNPHNLFHATPEKNIELIKHEGLKKQNITRGISNKHVTSAVFTSEYPDSSGDIYGPAVFEINTLQMKKDGFTPKVEKEPTYTENEVINFLAHKIKAWDEDRDFTQRSDGTQEDTIIFFDNIPPKYLTLISK